MGIFVGGGFPDGNCPRGIIRVGIFRVGDFLVPNQQPQAFHKDINLGPANLSANKPFHVKKFYLPSIIII